MIFMSYTYGKPFMLDGKKVMYRYTDKKKSTKTLVDSKKKPIKARRTRAQVMSDNLKSYGRRK